MWRSHQHSSRLYLVLGIMATVFSYHLTLAQSPPLTPLPRSSFVLEIDPLAYFYRGFALEGAFSIENHRLFVEAVSLDVPSFITDVFVSNGENYSERRNIILGIGYSYFFFEHQKGLFAGMDISNSSSTFTHKMNRQSVNTETLRLGIRLGYTFYPLPFLPNLLISPWISPRIGLNIQDIPIGQEIIKRGNVDAVGALHIGWRF